MEKQPDQASVDIELDPEDVILLVLEANERVLGRKVLRGITRLEKLVYLLKRETAFDGIATLFLFKEHYFGPYSEQVVSATEFLEGIQLIEVDVVDLTKAELELTEADLLSDLEQRRIEKRYRLTASGRRIAKHWRDHLPEDDLAAVDSILRQYGTMPLNQLIRYVYRKYPETTVNSIHPEAKR